MAGEVNIKVSAETLKTWEKLAEKISAAEKNLEEIIKNGGKIKSSIGDSSTMKDVNAVIKELGDNIKKLSAEQEALVKANKKLKESTKDLDKEEKARNKEVERRAALSKQRSREYIRELKEQAIYAKKLATDEVKSQKLVDQAKKQGSAILAGYVQNTRSFNAIVSQGKQRLKEEAAEQRKATAERKKAIAAQNKARIAQEKLNKTKKSSISGIATLSKSLRGLIGIYIGWTAVMRTFRAVFDTTKELDSLRFATQNIITDTAEYAETQAYLNKIVEAYGLNLFDATRSYIKFRAAVGATNLTVAEGRKIFESFAKAGAVLGLRADEMNGVFLALEQMISKGKVTTEELRRQLGERIPGAFNIMANAMGVSVSKLDDMLRKGEVLAEDALPKLAAELEKTFGIEAVEKVNTLVAAQERIRTTWRAFIKELSMSQTFIDGLSEINTAIKAIANNMGLMLPSADKGFENASLAISDYVNESESAVDAQDKVREAFIRNNETIAEQEKLLKDAKEFLAPKTVSDVFSGDFGIKSDRFGTPGNARQIVAEGEAMMEQLKAQRKAYVDFLNLSEDEVNKKRNEVNQQEIDTTVDDWAERLSIYKSNQAAELAAFKERQENERALIERTMRENGATELQMDRASAALSMELDENVSTFKQEQLSDRVKFTAGHLRDQATAEKELANEVASITKKKTDFQISEAEKEHTLYLNNMKEKADAANDTKNAEIAAIETRLLKQIEALRYFAAIQEGFAKKDGEFKLIDENMNKLAIQATIDSLNELLAIEDLTARERLAIEKRLHDAKMTLVDIETDKRKEAAAERLAIQAKVLDLVASDIMSTFSIFQDFQQAELDALEVSYEHKTNLAGENLAMQLAADNAYERQKAKILKRQAIAERAQAAFSIILNTAQAIMATLGQVGFFGAPLAAIVAATGALQLGAVLSTPIPSYQEGGEHDGGLARYSEEGSELFIPVGGMPVLTPENETISDMPKGTFVPHKETQRILAQGAMNNFVNETSDISLGTTNGLLRKMANKTETNYRNGFKMTKKNSIFGRYVTRL